VRNPDEIAEVRVPGVTPIPLPELPDRLADVPEADTVYMICKSGGRSLRACELLEGVGRTAVNVAGGTTAWVDSGRPAESGE